jgi:N-acetylglutamate synthase-like GNAT family acetyltransferase
LKEAHTLIREASLADISKLQTVLIQAQLSDDDILADGTRYWLAENVDGQPVGIVGLELGETVRRLLFLPTN